MYVGKAFNIKNDEAFLKQNHDYYYQIQGQLSVTKRQYCLFVIFTLVGIKTMVIEKNDEFIEAMIIKIADFYYDCLIPEIIDSRRKRRLPIREPEYIQQTKIERKKLVYVQIIKKEGLNENHCKKMKKIRPLKSLSYKSKKVF